MSRSRGNPATSRAPRKTKPAVVQPVVQQVEGISTQRLNYRKLLASICSEDPLWWDLSDEDREKMAINLEKICLNRAVLHAKELSSMPTFDNAKFVYKYSDTGYKIMSAIKRTSTSGDQSMLARCVRKELPLATLGSQPMEVLDPEATRLVREFLELRSHQKVDEEPSTFYRCNKCGMSKTKRQTYSSRCGDEGDTCLITCMNCQNYWYIS